ncbi:hypothetical protein P873_09565 [Arenimonas composti TR7-09 = DSM 18010]|uniref:AB hydrolase-1 domain-containing protein n=1 Tax=Arenimonas composti TR7-09 = DSM 18010 TaxID=1121013 RepID=A0A091BAU4_9GAMM|nr:hypothetical protein P873_09565 [Arenimonas composti TR7-09 = DSM 18010]
MLAIDASEKLEAVSVPLLYLMATHDRVVPVSALKQIERVLPATQVVSVNAPHFLLQAAPIEAAAAVSEFIRPLHDAS